MLFSVSQRAWARAALAGPIVASGLFGVAGAWAAECPTAAEPHGLSGAHAQQVEVEEAKTAGVTLTYAENPLFAEDVKAGKLRPVAERLPKQPLIVLPYA